MSVNNRRSVAYGFSAPLLEEYPLPIISQRAPTTGDKAPLGSMWVDVPNDDAYIITSIVANVATWQLIIASGGAAVLSSLTVTPGPISLTGSTIINNTGAANTAIGTGTNSGILALGNTANGGTSIEGANITMDSAAAGSIFVGTQLLGATVDILGGANTAAQVVNILNGANGANASVNILSGNATAGLQAFTLLGGTQAGTVDIARGAAAHTVVIGNADVNASVALAAGIIGGIDLSAGGTVTMTAAAVGPIASPTVTATNDFNVGAVTFSGFTTAAGAAEVFTIQNATATIASQIFVTACNEGANDAQMTVTRVERQAGAFVVTLTNNGAAALNGDITINFWKISA